MRLVFQASQESMHENGGRVKENIDNERLPRCDSFTPFYLWQYRRNSLRYAMGVKHEKFTEGFAQE
jgi:hypothetical protein